MQLINILYKYWEKKSYKPFSFKVKGSVLWLDTYIFPTAISGQFSNASKCQGFKYWFSSNHYPLGTFDTIESSHPTYPTLFGLAPDIAELSKYQKIYSQKLLQSTRWILKLEHLPSYYHWTLRNFHYFRVVYLTEQINREKAQMICTKLLIRKTLFYLEVKLCKLRTLKSRYMHLSIFQFYGGYPLECCKIRSFINYADHNLCWKLNYRDGAFHVWSPIHSTNTLAANKSI